MRITLPFCLLLFNVGFCHAFVFPLHGEIPVEENANTQQDGGGEAMRMFNVYDTDMLEDVVSFMDDDEEEVVTNNGNLKRYEMSYNGGQNCGKKKENQAIYIHNLDISDPVTSGGNVTVSADVEVKEDHRTATLLTVGIHKVVGRGNMLVLPCWVTGGVNLCNVTDPCMFLEFMPLLKIPCPQEILDGGWNCRCPLLVHQYSFAPVTRALPHILLPSYIVAGRYRVKVQLFDGKEEILCYNIQVAVKEAH